MKRMGKGKELGRVSRKGGIRGLRGITISTHNVGGAQGGKYSTEKTSSYSTASYYVDGQ